MEPTVKFGLVAAPQLPPDRDGFLEVGTARVEAVAVAEVAELGRVPAHADADDQPPTG